MKNIFKTIIVGGIFGLLILFAINSCGSATEKDRPIDPAASDPVTRAEADYDPLTDARDRTVLAEQVQPGDLIASRDNFDWARADSFMQAQKVIDSSLTVYRVQLFASQYYTEAKYEQQIADEVFSDSVFVKYDLPYYKVLLGNATTEKAGRRLLYTARSLGYYNSWLIESPPDSIFYRLIYIQDSLAVQDSLSTIQDQELEPLE